MRAIAWSLQHPRLVVAVWMLICLASLGLLGGGLAIQLNPTLPPQMVMVVARHMGVSTLDTEQLATLPLERALAQVEGVRSQRSQTFPGMVMVTLEFPYRMPLEPALSEVRSRLAGLDTLQDWQLEARAMEPLRPALLHLALHHPTPDQVEWLETTGLPQLRKLPGVASVSVLGQPQPVWDIMADPDRLARHGLTLEELYRKLQAVPRERGLGELRSGGSPTVTLENGERRADDPGSWRILDRPRPVSLREVAEVMRRDDPAAPLYRHNGVRGLQVCLQALPDVSTPALVQRVQRWMADSSEQGLHFHLAFDGSALLRRMLWDFAWTMALGVGLLTLALGWFLREPRGVLIVLATLPSALSMALVGLYAFGFSLNSSTLIGLLLALGRLVDDSVLDLDAVRRYLARGLAAQEAVLRGCSEVRRAVLSSTLVTLLACLVLTRVGGVVQDMFEAIAWAYALALGASLAVAFTLTPVLASWLYARADRLPALGGEKLRQHYRAGLPQFLARPGLVLGLASAACYLSLVLVPRVGYEMMPLADTGQMLGFLEGPPGSSRAQLERLAQGVEKLLLEQPEVREVSCEIGGTTPTGWFSGHGQMGENSATLWITLNQRRRRSLWEVADSLEQRARQQYPNLRRLTFKELGADVMASASAPLELVLRGPDLSRLSWLGEQMVQLGPAVGAVHPSTSWSLAQPQIELRGVTDPVSTRRGLGGGSLESSGISSEPWMLSYRASVRKSPWQLERWGQQARSSLAPERIDRDQGQRSLTVSGFYRKGGRGSMQAQMDWLMAARMQLPVPSNYQLELRGEMVLMMDSFRRLSLALGVAVVLIYGLLAVQFQSLTLPLLLLVSIPLELPGVVAGLLLTEQSFSSVSLLGLVVLHGMDLTASLLLVDALYSRPRDGQPLNLAIAEAMPRRLLPILLTAGITVALMLPLAWLPGRGFDAYAPLVTVIVGGLISSTFLSLWVTPVLLQIHGGFGRVADESGVASEPLIREGNAHV